MDPSLLIVLIVFFVPGVVAFSMAKHRVKGGVGSILAAICAVLAFLLAHVGMGSVSEFYVIVVAGLAAIAFIGTAAGAFAGWCEVPG